MKIAISGCHSQGKTTLVESLEKDPDINSIFEFRTNLTRDLKEKGVPINTQGDMLTQYLVISKHIERVLEPKNLILDRCILDGFVYTDALMFMRSNLTLALTEYQNDLNLLGYIQGIIPKVIPKYDAIFYIEPELPLKDDGVRSLDQEFFEVIKKTFELTIRKYSIPVHRIKGTVEERHQVVKDVIGQLMLVHL